MQGLWTVPAHTLHRLPDNLSLEQGALIEPIAVACHDVRLGEVKSGEFVVVLGGGPIGVLVACVARNEGARVVVSEVNPFRLKLAADLGWRP
jgi:Threonine dehydrogenase and related Zn-dependent dehydrogenases